MTVQLLGGIGVFLLGMVLLTEGLKGLAGGALRRGLARFTGSPLRAVATGAVATAVIQSSTATTMTTIGLVAAGLLPIVNAVGIILGANLGTTSTAWIVAYFGLKVDITSVALLMVAIGAVMRLLGKERVAAAAFPIAGFGLLFVGIGLMQSAMAGVAEGFPLPGAGETTLGASLLLVLIGAAMTIVMQSSSAAVATTLTALSAGAIGLEQAAAMVIGQNVGTAPKALLAALGASVHARRTAMAHVVFNVGTAAVALAILPSFAWIGARLGGEGGDAALTLAAFHTLFNVVGVALVLPWLGRFTFLVARLVPEWGVVLTRYLSNASAEDGRVAVDAARTTLLMCTAELGDEAIVLATRVVPAREQQGARIRLERVRSALDETRTFLADVRSDPSHEADHRRHVSVLHALDHLQRATVLLLVRSAALERFARAPEAGELRDHMRDALQAMVTWSPLLAPDGPADHVIDAFGGVPEVRRAARRRVLRLVATADADPDEADDTLEALAWANAFAHHLQRAVHHMREPAPGDEA